MQLGRYKPAFVALQKALALSTKHTAELRNLSLQCLIGTPSDDSAALEQQLLQAEDERWGIDLCARELFRRRELPRAVSLLRKYFQRRDFEAWELPDLKNNILAALDFARFEEHFPDRFAGLLDACLAEHGSDLFFTAVDFQVCATFEVHDRRASSRARVEEYLGSHHGSGQSLGRMMQLWRAGELKALFTLFRKLMHSGREAELVTDFLAILGHCRFDWGLAMCPGSGSLSPAGKPLISRQTLWSIREKQLVFSKWTRFPFDFAAFSEAERAKIGEYKSSLRAKLESLLGFLARAQAQSADEATEARLRELGDCFDPFFLLWPTELRSAAFELNPKTDFLWKSFASRLQLANVREAFNLLILKIEQQKELWTRALKPERLPYFRRFANSRRRSGNTSSAQKLLAELHFHLIKFAFTREIVDCCGSADAAAESFLALVASPEQITFLLLEAQILPRAKHLLFFREVQRKAIERVGRSAFNHRIYL